MSSSSIEVMGMGGEDMKVVLLENSIHDEEMAQRMQDIIHSTGPPGHIIDTGPPLSQYAGTGQDEEFAQIDEFSSLDGVDPPPGTIIFSPQDLVRPTKLSTRGRGRGRGMMPIIKHEPNQILGSKDLEMSVACEICGKHMMTGKTLVQHMAIHSDLKPFQCPHCPKSFARKVHLQGHLVIHGIEKQFECPVCHQRFSRQDCVKVHMRLHDKSKCVYCDVCHKAFLTVGALNIHLRIHRGEKPFKCHLCSKCFTQKNHLITHIKRHTKVTDEHFTKKLGPRMFKCEHCTRAFIRLSDYERHVQWNHGAVADGSIIDKLPTVGNLLDGEMKQTGFAPQIFKAPKDALKNKVAKYQSRRGRTRVMMCTTSTQTDEDGGHVIIPRMYQNRISAGTQVSAPPTPRPNDDDMYENDIFDEGMDRNYSSEDEDDPEDLENDEERKMYAVAETSDMASDPVQDAAFDAIIQGSSAKSLNSVSLGGKMSNKKQAVFLQEVVSSISKQGLDVREEEEEEEEEVERITPDQIKSENRGLLRNQEGIIIGHDDDTCESQEEDQSTIPEREREIVVHELKQRLACAEDEERQQSQEEERMQIIENDEEQSQELGEALITVNREELEDQSQEALPSAEGTLNMENTGKLLMKSPFQPPPVQNTRGRGRPRGRGRGKLFWNGLTGAAELRAIRKSMMQILHANQENKEEENTAEGGASNEETEESRVVVSVSAEEGESEVRGKRMAKKQHGKDFVCNMKNCETCVRSLKPTSKIQIKAKVKVREKDSADSEMLKAAPLLVVPRESPKPVAKAVPAVKAFPKPLVKEFRPPAKPVSSGSPFMQKLKDNTGASPAKKFKLERQDPLPEKREDHRMKVGNRVGTYPVDITANPLTNKKPKKPDYFVATSKSDSIVSPPVELMSFCIPTYSCKLCGREFRFEGKLHRHIESVHQNKAIFSADVKPGRSSGKGMPGTYIPKLEEMARPQPTLEPENPEIAALRSEWDDDDDDDDDEDENENPIAVPADDASVPSMTTYTSQPFTIVTREITPVTTTVSESQYASGVKVNMNKLAGLLSTDRNMPISSQGESRANSVTRVITTTTSSLSRHPRDTETIMADTLDAKCRRLLEKLFDHDLLLNCGLLEEHVSVVLGRVLQHYGVKMIEDYGQGQYEVLKYNLWRLIEWKVTMEQMEEFYTAGKSVEEMMDDIMNERVPLVSHHFVPHEQKAHPPTQVSQAGQVTQVEAVEVTDGQMVLQQVAGVLGGQLNLPEGVTQVVLAQDVSPELLQGAHIVTIDPTTGQVISQVTADQVILTDAIGDELEQQVAALDGQVVVSQAHIVDQESIVVPQSTAISVHGGQGQISHGQVVVHAAPHQHSVKLETSGHAAAQQHHPHHQ